jgi:hypothetical protein
MEDMLAVLSVASLRQNRAKPIESREAMAGNIALSLEGSGFEFRPQN